MPRKLTKILSFFLCFLLIFEQSGFAQVAGELDISGHFLQLRNSLLPDKFRPLHLRYLSYDTLNNNFKLLLDKGDFLKGLSPKGTVPEEKLKEQTRTLLNYFFIGISLPNDSFWVNLRPDSPDQVIDDELAKTDIGRILLEQDLQLKKDTAQFTSPETLEGKEYWDKLYKKAGELFGSENITIPTLTRPWIVPGEIIIRETPDNAYVYKATLKVMLEQDYLKDSAVYNFKDERLKALNEYSSQLIRELIIPKLTQEVNNAKRYAPLRQVYYSLILAQWFKARFYGKSGLYASLIDRKNLNGLTSEAPWSKTTYFQAYQKSFQKGEYNLKEPVYTPFGQTIRSYMSGGIILVPEGRMPPLAKTGEINHSAASPVTIVGGSLTKDVRGRGTLGFIATGGPENISLKPEEKPQPGLLQKTEPEIKPPEAEKETSSPIAESAGTISPIQLSEDTLISQEDLPKVYWEIIAPYAKQLVFEAKLSAEQVEKNEISIESRQKKLNDIIVNAVNALYLELRAVSSDRGALERSYIEIINRVRKGSEQQNFATAMAFFVGEQMTNNGNGEFTNIFFPRDAGLLYISDLVIGMLNGQKREPRLYYISGRNNTFGKYYRWMKEDAIKIAAKGSKSFEVFLFKLEDIIREKMSDDPEFKEKVEQIQDDLERMGVSKLEKVRFVDSGFQTFPLMFCAITHMKWKHIEVQGLVQASEQNILAQLNKAKWVSRAVRWVSRKLHIGKYAEPNLWYAEIAEGFLEHPFKDPGPSGIMRLSAPHVQLQAYWTQLAFVLGAIHYHDMITGLAKELETQGIPEELAKIIKSDLLQKLYPKSGQIDWASFIAPLEDKAAQPYISKEQFAKFTNDYGIKAPIIITKKLEKNLDDIYNIKYKTEWPKIKRILSKQNKLKIDMEAIYNIIKELIKANPIFITEPIVHEILNKYKKYYNIINKKAEEPIAIKTDKDKSKFKKWFIAILLFMIFLKGDSEQRTIPPYTPQAPRIEQQVIPPEQSLDMTAQAPKIISSPEPYFKHSYNGLGNKMPYEKPGLYDTGDEKLLKVYKFLKPKVDSQGINFFRKLLDKDENRKRLKNASGRPLNKGDIRYFYDNFNRINPNLNSLNKHGRRAIEAAIGAYQIDNGGNPTFDINEGSLASSPAGKNSASSAAGKAEEHVRPLVGQSGVSSSSVIEPQVVWRESFAKSVPWKECTHLINDRLWQAIQDSHNDDSFKLTLVNAAEPKNRNELNYFKNQQQIRLEVIKMLKRIRQDGRSYSMNDFKKDLGETHRILFEGRDGASIYIPDSLVGNIHLYYSYREHSNNFRDFDLPPTKLEPRLEKMLESLRNIVGFQSGKDTVEDLLRLITDFYRAWLGAKNEDYLFQIGNNSPLMNIINGILRLHGLKGIAHVRIDWYKFFPDTETDITLKTLKTFSDEVLEENPQYQLSTKLGDIERQDKQADNRDIGDEVNPSLITPRPGAKGSSPITEENSAAPPPTEAQQSAASSPAATGYQQAMAQLNEFIDAIKKGKYQQKAVVDLRNLPPGVEVILVGDLHARLDNLKKILNNNDNLKKIQRGEAILVILGDAVHSETNLKEMDSSVEIMRFIMDLKIQNPHSVYYLLGNHDYLSSLEMKDGVQQGLLYWDRLEYLYGTGYIDSYDNFIKASPLMAIGNGFIATHAGPIKGATYREIQDVDVANEESDIVRQAERGRYGERFGEEDIRKFIHNMGQPEEASLIVGHSPTRDGDWHWRPLPNSHFHIIFAGHDRAGYAYIQNGRLDFTEVTNVSPNLELVDSAASPVSGKQLEGAESTSSPLGQQESTPSAMARNIAIEQVEHLTSELMRKGYQEDPRIGLIVDEELKALLRQPAEYLLGLYENNDIEEYDHFVKSVISFLIGRGFSDRAIRKIIGEGIFYPAPSAGIIDMALSLLREKLEQEGAPEVVSLIKRVVKNNGRILEIGVGEGDFIKGLRERDVLPLGYNGITSIDIDDEAITKAAAKGVEVIKKDAKTLDRSFGAFNMTLIIYPETLDMRDFYEIFMSALGILEPGGLLVILTKDTAAMDRHFSVIGNVIKHSKKQLREEIPHTFWKPSTSYEYVVVKKLPIIFSGEKIEDVIATLRTKHGQGAVRLDASDTNKDVSSPVKSPAGIDKEKPGGIDFRGLPIVTQTMGSSSLGTVPLAGQVRPLSGIVPSLNLDKEWQQIENMAQAGLIPSNERIREYLQTSCQSEDCSQRIDKVLSLFADILRLEEERVSSTEPALKDILALLESDKEAAELQVALSKIEVLPQEPQLIEQ